MASIEELLEQGKVAQARAAIVALPMQHPQRAVFLRRVDDLDLRKAQRQAKVGDFLRLARSPHQLALARLQGQQALVEFASSDHPDAPRAAVASAGDDTALRKALRRLPGPAELGLGFAALVAGDQLRAEQALKAAVAADSRRAQLGLSLLAARREGPQSHPVALTAIPSLPGSVFPATAQLRKRLQQQQRSHQAPSLRELLINGSTEALKQALKSWPQQDSQARAWLFLRLGDRQWAQSSNDEGHIDDPDTIPSLIQTWDQAANLNAALLADVSKRLLSLAGDSIEALQSACTRWWQLYVKEPQLAGQILDAVSHDLIIEIIECWLSALLEFKPKQLGTSLPPCLVLMELRVDSAIARYENEPMAKDAWKSVCRDLDQAYGEQPLWLNLKLSILQDRGDMIALRRCCAALIRQQPDRLSELLPIYIDAANNDRRSRKQIAVEVQELLGIAPQDPHLLLLAYESNVKHNLGVDLSVAELIQALSDTDSEQLSTWAHYPWGQHASVDQLRLTRSQQFSPAHRQAWLTTASLHCIHQQLCALNDLLLRGCLPIIHQWRKDRPLDWRAIYHLLRFLRDSRDQSQTPQTLELLLEASLILRDEPPATAPIDHHRARLTAWTEEFGVPDTYAPDRSRLPQAIQNTNDEDTARTRPKLPPLPTTHPNKPRSLNWRDWMSELSLLPATQNLFANLEQAHVGFTMLLDPLICIMDLAKPSPLPGIPDVRNRTLALELLRLFRDHFHRQCDIGQLSALEVTIANWHRHLKGS